MTKTFCDCCGKEIVNPNRTFERISVSVPIRSVQKELAIVKQQPIHGDVCEQCIKAKVLDALRKEIDEANKKEMVKITPPPRFSHEYAGTSAKMSADTKLDILTSAIREATEDAFQAQEILTRDQFVEALMQAIKSGDFLRHVKVENTVVFGGQMQCVTYEPFRRVQELEERIKMLKRPCDRCGQKMDELTGEDA